MKDLEDFISDLENLGKIFEEDENGNKIDFLNEEQIQKSLDNTIEKNDIKKKLTKDDFLHQEEINRLLEIEEK